LLRAGARSASARIVFKSVVRPRTLPVFNRATGNTRAEHTRGTRTVILHVLVGGLCRAAPKRLPHRSQAESSLLQFQQRRPRTTDSPHRQNDQDEVFLLKKPNLFVV
jgi:hypothetical protein